VLVLRERLRAVQWTAVAMASTGVAWMTWQTGRLPWVALVLAGSFALYGLLRKTATLGALEGLALENLVLAPLSVPALAWWTLQHDGVLLRGDPVLIGWLILGGPLTALPLLFFADAARRLSLATLGLMQYLGPSLQFVLALTVFHEAFDRHRLIGFVLIWLALALVSTDALLRRDRGPSRPDCDGKLHAGGPDDDAASRRTDSPPAARSSGYGA
jgi:chloramphenicol-sensitive protein RarD